MRNSAKWFLLLHLILGVYASSSVCSKLAAQQPFLSVGFILLYGGMLAALVVYAFGWQQVIKHLPLTTAYANKAITVVWGILLGFLLGAVSSVVLAVAAERWAWVEALLSPVMQLVKATPVASFIILALVWVRGSSLSVLISFLMVLPVLYGAVRTGIRAADPQLLEMAKVFRLPLGRRLRAVWLPAVLPAFRQGCSVALGICWKSGVAAEVIGLPNGSIGDALYRAKITLSTGELFAWTFVIILLSAAFEKLFLRALDAVSRALIGGEEDAAC